MIVPTFDPLSELQIKGHSVHWALQLGLSCLCLNNKPSGSQEKFLAAGSVCSPEFLIYDKLQLTL